MNSASIDSGSGSLLIVETDETEIVRLKAVARAMGISDIHIAESGREALRLLGDLERPPTAMAVDLDIPEVDGIALVQRLHVRGVRIPVALLSSQANELVRAVEFMIEQMGIPFLGALSKPIDFEEARTLLRRVRQISSEREPPFPGLRCRSEAMPTGSELAQAITSGQIHVHYQPKIAFADGHLVGVEALARWTHPTHGEVSPDTFIGLAERTGLIHPLTMSVLDQAMGEAAKWNLSGLGLSVAVNLSPQLLESPDIVEEILRIQQLHDVAPEQVTLEITESSSAHQFISAVGVLARLRLKGFVLSIDDYGTGYSSMQQLAKIPFKELKFDRSFVKGATRHENHRIILSSSIEMSKKLGLSTVAEGIETEAEWQLLKGFGCAVGQGWHIAKAMPASMLLPWIEKRGCGLPIASVAA